MTDLTTLSAILGSQEARDAAPCVPAVEGYWYLSRRNGMHHLNPGKDDGWAWKPDGSHFATTDFDCLWSGDLPALLAALVAERDGLAAKLARIDCHELTDVEIEAALTSEGVHTWGPDGERFERMFRAAMKARTTIQEQQP